VQFFAVCVTEKNSGYGISTETWEWVSIEPVQTDVQIKKKKTILYEKFYIFSPTSFQVY
jgi:hypothetical protein